MNGKNPMEALLSRLGVTPSGAEGAPAKGRYQRVSPQDAHRMMKELERHVLLDVRTPDEYRQGHIPGAVLVPNYELKARIRAALPDLEIPVFVYCLSGARSMGAARQLVRMGYRTVYDLGGLVAWPYGTVAGMES